MAMPPLVSISAQDYRGALGSKLLRNPMAPGLIAWTLLVIAHILTPQPLPGTSAALFTVGVLFIGLFAIGRHVLIPLPWVPPRDVRLLFGAGLAVLALEILYFRGLPLLGSVVYTDFGLPVLHHVVFSMWALPLLAPRRALPYLIVPLIVGAAMFNRQMILLTLISYLMRSGTRNMVVPGLVGLCVVALGSLRNEMLGVEQAVAQVDEARTGLLGDLFFWAYLYVVGPYSATFAFGTSDTGSIDIATYWNTVPEWARFARLGLPLGCSLALYYSLLALVVTFLTRVRLFEARVFGALIQVLSCLTFFSNTLLSTPVIAALLIVATLRRGQQIFKPTHPIRVTDSIGGSR